MILTTLAYLYAIGALVFLVGGLLSGKDEAEQSTLSHVATCIGLAVFWLPGLLLLVLFFVYWGIVGD